MKQLKFFAITIIATLMNQIAMAQDSKLIDNLKSGQTSAESEAKDAIDVFMGYFDIVIAVIFVMWVVQAFRASRANTDDDSGEGFSIIKWGSWRAGVIIFYIVARAAIIPALFE